MSFDSTLDRREAIIERLVAISQEITGISSVWRNHQPTPTGVLGVPYPAIIVYDGDTKLTQDLSKHKNPRVPPTIWCMSPELVVVLANRDNVDNNYLNGVWAPVGPELSHWFALLDGAITNDDQLIDLVTANGYHQLTAARTDQKLGDTRGALGSWLQLCYEFYYPRFPLR